MLGGLLSLLSAVTFAYANASMRRGVLTGTVLQAVGISLPVALPIFVIAMLPTGGFGILAAFSGRSWLLLAIAGVIHFAWGRYCNYRATKAMGANLVAPVQQYSLVITLVLAVLWLREPLTLLRIVGIALVIAGPGLTLRPDKPAQSEVVPETPSETTFIPQYAEGYMYSLLSAIGFGLSPILIGMAFEKKGIAVGIAGGFVSYLAATLALALTLLLPGKWSDFRDIDRSTMKWFVFSGIAVCLSQMTRYMALAVAPVSVVSPIQRLSIVFRIYFSWWLNPKHEVFGSRVVAGTIISLIGAVALSVSTDDLTHMLTLPAWLAGPLAWHWP
ncbi:MAG TPA: EamA family transporter [Bradyrhizobium sp.]|uniref:EamA family transporter n=1 Tax=Bradyrhizobium sp. TaxID=376 RepID=UPI002B49CB88|nr:EamA family transporter [Bradyrhizobium sp.]HKO71594.1 EamA family transporter [Bradyrhizobium sp.]